MPTVRRGDVPPDVWEKLRAAGSPSAPPRPVRGRSDRKELVVALFREPGLWWVPLVTTAEVNGRDWHSRSARTQAARRAVSRVFGPTLRHLAPFAEAYHAGRVLRATLTRLGGRGLDPGNLPTALKAAEDAVCLLIGADDGDNRWAPVYRQEPGGAWGVRVELEVPE